MKKSLLSLIVLLPMFALAQNENYVSLNFAGGSTGTWFNDSYNEISVDFESRVSKLSGIGVGIGLARFNNDNYLAVMDYIHMPIFYKLHTKWLNMSPVFTMDFLNRRMFSSASSWTDFSSYYPIFFYGFGLAVSKDFFLTNKLYLETKAQAIYSPEVEEIFSIGLALKYRLN